MIYNRTTWENSPSTSTPINAQNLNKIEQGITDAANEINTISHMVNVGTEVEEDSRVNFIKSKNLFDKNNVNKLVGYFNESTPTITSNEFNRTLYLPCNENTTYTITIPNGTGAYAIGYTTTIPTIGSSVSGVSNTSKTITTGANAKYLVVRYFQTNNATITEQQAFDGIQIEYGETATSYEEFIPNQIVVDNEKYTDTINVGQFDSRSRVNVLKSKNLFENIATTQTINGITYTKNSDGTITANGTASANASITLGKIKTDSSKSYSLSGCPSGGSQSTYTMYISGANPAINDFGSGVAINNKEFDNNLIFVVFSGKTVSNMVIKPMLNEGTTILDYEPYIVPSINVDGETIVNKNVYSSNEIVIGEWFGKPLYRKVVILNSAISLTANNWTNITTDATIKAIIKCWASDTNYFEIGYSYPIIARVRSDNSIQFYSYIASTIRTYILEYTKSTD